MRMRLSRPHFLFLVPVANQAMIAQPGTIANRPAANERNIFHGQLTSKLQSDMLSTRDAMRVSCDVSICLN